MIDNPAHHQLEEKGWTVIGNCLSEKMCDEIKSNYEQQALYRSQVIMSRHGFGSGEYKYFQYPLPNVVQKLREHFYQSLLPIANHWQSIWEKTLFPQDYQEFLSLCSEAEQARPTPLILKYGVGDYNRLHQDLYGQWVFPLQVAILLSEPRRDFDGGEFVLTEQKPRSQSRASVVPLTKGDAVVFAVNQRPVKSQRGYYRVQMRHGVSEVTSGERHVLGIILQDAT